MFADRISWRAAFYADMIMGALTTVYLAIVLRLPRPESAPTWGEGIRSLDYLGVTIIIASVSLIIVGMNMGGTLLSWSSPATIICLVVGCVLLGVFVVVELRIPRVPLVPMWIFTVRNLIISCVVTFLCGMCMFSIIFYMPVYFSAVFGANAMRAGLLVLPFGVALSVSSFVSGYFMSALGKYQLFLRLGPAIMAVGVLVLALLSGKTSQISYALLLLIPGVGMGNIIVANVIAAQATTDPRFIATVTPLCEFFLSIGGVIGVAVFGAVHRNRLAKILTASALGEPQSAQVIINEARKDVSVVYMSPSISDPLRMKIADAYASSMTTALWVLLPFLIVAFILSLVLEKSPTKAAPKEAPVPPRSESTEHML
ncbi:MFS general substrate transporter [Martensiomyces pterosporus]|nr:MFS general substrate transporter [Martensiomyces pterosporus]